jgi:hypothetical protein
MSDPLAAILGFLSEIGQPVRPAEVPAPSVLPGIAIDHGTLLVDRTRLLAAGDLLHEAGHLAVLDPADRERVDLDAGDDGGLEMAAIAWSWAALSRLGLPPEVVFHAEGYQGGSASLIENFSSGRWFGVPILEWLGLTATGARAAELGVAPFPAMIRWRR